MEHCICLKVKLHTILHCTMNVARLSMHLPDTKPKWRWWLIEFTTCSTSVILRQCALLGGSQLWSVHLLLGHQHQPFTEWGKWENEVMEKRRKTAVTRTWKTSRRGQIEAVGSIFARILPPPGHLYIKGEKQTLPFHGDGKFQKEHVE